MVRATDPVEPPSRLLLALELRSIWEPQAFTGTDGIVAWPAALTEVAVPVLRAVTDKAIAVPKVSGSEDFSEFQAVAPSFFFFLGTTPKGKSPGEAASNHSPAFDFDEDAMAVGAEALAALALNQWTRPAQVAAALDKQTEA
jgi:hypothetical protein